MMRTTLLTAIFILFVNIPIKAMEGVSPEKTTISLKNYVAIGMYVYWDEVLIAMGQRSLPKWQVWEQVVQDLVDHHCNTIMLGHAPSGEDLKEACRIAKKYNLNVIPQMDETYYPHTLPKEQRLQEYKLRIKPAFEKIIPQFRGNGSILAWSPVEETYVDTQEEIAEHRDLIRKLDPTHPIVCLHSNLDAAQRMAKVGRPYPDVILNDSYWYRYAPWLEHPENKATGAIPLIMPNLAGLSFLERLDEYYQVAREMDIPLWAVPQSVGGTIDMPAGKSWDSLPSDIKEKIKQNDCYSTSGSSWVGFSYYMPPEESLEQQCWMSLASGARGIIFYAYNHCGWVPGYYHYKDTIPKYQVGEVAMVNGPYFEPITEWDSIGKVFKQIRKFIPMISRWTKDAKPSFQAQNAVVRTFHIKGVEGTFIVVVNQEIGRWLGGQSNVIYPPSKVRIDMNYNSLGRLTGIEKVPPRNFKLVPVNSDSQPLWDLSTGTRLKDNIIRLNPGSGAVIFVGSLELLQPLKF
jgi:hypothetical protein